MIVTGICHNGRLVLRKVDQKTKINSNIYQTLVLDPIFQQDIPYLYGNETDKVWFHCDKAPSHTSGSTANFRRNLCNKTKINVIPFNSIPVKSPDLWIRNKSYGFLCFWLAQESSWKTATSNGRWIMENLSGGVEQSRSHSFAKSSPILESSVSGNSQKSWLSH